MSNEKLVRKILMTLTRKFAHKVTATEEAQDLTTMRVDELMDNLTTFEMSLDDGESGKKKGRALKAASENVDDEDLVETMKLLAKNFNKSLKRFNKKPYGGTSYPNANDKGNNIWNKPMKQEDEDDQEGKISNFVAFVAHTEPPVDDNGLDNNEDKDEMTEEELLEDYKYLYTKWTELTIVYTIVETKKGKLKKENEKLTQLVLDCDEEINNLNSQLKALNKGLTIRKVTVQTLALREENSTIRKEK
ncbi:hypothetical protein LIER_08918 [Lithospermum erythrorhizon]|uniref:Gag-pol polyprotein n=1 Tax=Lithospermum erythrorhizon TaxID=34254 RepID=A0AAV3PDW0_LITER